MPVTTLHPGVYIEEVPSAVRAIGGASTSVAATMGYTARGAVNEPVRCHNFGDFERAFGGLHPESDVGYTVQQFFLNGGKEIWVVRLARDAERAAVSLHEEDGDPRLRVEARSEGAWGNLLRVDVDYATSNPDSTFNLTVTEHVKRGIETVLGRVETYRNLSMNKFHPRYAPDLVTKQSDLVDVTRIGAAGHEAWSRSGDLATLFDGGAWPDPAKQFIGVMAHGQGPFDVPAWSGGAGPDSLWKLKESLQAGLGGTGVPALAALTVEVLKDDGTVAADEAASDADGTYLRLRGTHPTDAERSLVQVVAASAKDASALLKLGLANGGRERDGAAGMRPAQTGSVSKDLSYVADDDVSKTQVLKLTITDGPKTTEGEFDLSGGATPTLAALAARFQEKLANLAAAKPEFKDAKAEVVGTRIRIRLGAGSEHARLQIATKNPPAQDVLHEVLGFDQPHASNVRAYALGLGSAGLQGNAVEGKDGIPPQLAEYKGSEAAKEGIYALEKVESFNLLSIPFLNQLDDATHATLFAEAAAYCERRRAFLVADPPSGLDTPAEVAAWAGGAPRSKNAAVYWPEVHVADPLADNRLRVFPPSGTVAGLYARTDSARGVWKAPAGTEATLTNVQGLEYVMTDAENGVLNPIAVNCLRQFPVYGRVSWGARTLVGADVQASEWKYVPIRRLALHIEESLYRGTQWVVFEPNDEPLWSQIRLNVGAFMHDLYRKGAFQGASPKDAYFVKCDKETNPQDEIDRGIVNVLVGFAPLKPAEFVIIKISQIAAQEQA